MTIGNTTNITPPRVSLIDERTGAVSREWYRWFYSLFTILGSGTGIIPVDSGGTGLGTIPTNGQLLIGNGTGYSLNTLGTGAGISVVNGTGTITVANTGVLSNIAGAGVSVSSATGDVTIANTGVLSFSAGTTGLTPSATTTGVVTLAGKLVIANGGTNSTSTPTAGAVSYGTGTAYAFTAAGTAGQVLTSSGASVPTWTTPTTGTVTSVGLAMPVQFTVTNSPVTSSGTLTAAFTTQSANSFFAGPTSGVGAVPTFRALTTADLPALPYGTGTVTSVGLSLPSIIAVTNSPVTTNGTLTGTLTTQAVNSIFAGPSSGAAAAPTFRALTTADIPALTTGASILYGNNSGGFSNVTIGDGLVFASGTLNTLIGAKTSCVMATTANITLSGLQTIDGITTVAGDRVLVKNQTSVPTNGIYIASTGAWTRAPDMDTWAKVVGAYTTVRLGTLNASTGWLSSTIVVSGTIGVTRITWLQYANVTTYTAGFGLGLVGNSFYIPANGVTAGSYGAANKSLSATVNSSGIVTSLSEQLISIDASQVTSLAPVTITNDYTVSASDVWIINNKSGSACTVTLPAPATYSGRQLTFKNLQAQTLVSASSNIVPIDSTTAGTAILLDVVGNWATMVSDGTNWIIMQAASNNNLLLE
jgi:hypothetical protein